MERFTLRERQRQAREDAILDAAHLLLMEQGYATMSMDELAARVGASKATIYQHFSSKEDLAINVIVREMRRGEQRIMEHAEHIPAITRLEQTLRQGLQSRAGMWAARITLLPQSVLQHPAFQEQHNRLTETMGHLVDEAKAAGDIRPDLPTPIVVQALINLYRSNFDVLLERGEHTPSEVSDTLLHIVFNGIRVLPASDSAATP